MNELDQIRESSSYLATLLRRNIDFTAWLWDDKNLYRRYPLTGLYQDLQLGVQNVSSFGEMLSAFREFKQRHFLRIGGRDLLGRADLAETTSQLSDLACVALQVGLDMLAGHPEWWVGDSETDLWNEVQEKVDLVVIGLGKLGGNELNYVSDIDILFLHAQRGEARLPFSDTLLLLSSLCQRLARVMSDRIEGDQVFQVDLRLRPQGKDGVLVPSLAAATEHYLLSGHPWERQMLLKARPAAGARSLGMAFIQEVRPFVFRRFLDFQALGELRAMRDLILAEAVRPSSGWMQFDVKLGIGGIREIEFFVQSLQLIYAGRHPELDEPNTLRCLDRLLDLQLLTPQVMDDLKESYVFLRRVEHWVQLDQNRQTQKLPQSEAARRRLALALGFGGDYEAFLQKLEKCCSIVHLHFLELFHSSSEEQGRATKSSEPENADEADFCRLFPSESFSRLRDHLDAFLPAVRPAVWSVLESYSNNKASETIEKVIVRLERYFNQVRKRPGLVKVFDSSASWFTDFCRGLAQTELLSDLLSHNPSLVEGIAATSGAFQDGERWEAWSKQVLDKSKNYEEGLEWIRRLKNERLLQLILADLRGDLDYGTVECELSHLADFVIRNTYERVRKDLRMDQGLPLAVLSLGKLGSREMSYLSDLDLVFVYEPEPGESAEQIPPDVVRLTQRFMRMLSTPLQDGPGYMVDARLRPSGNYGPLIVTRKAWAEYYQEKADIWEIQALLRVRFIAGNHELGRWIEERARGICYQQRNPLEVWRRICHLRERMQRERSEENPDYIDIKLGMGGLADLEFLVQGHLLIEGYAVPAMQKPSVRLAVQNVLKNVPDLSCHSHEGQEAFESLRSLEHRLRLHTNLTSSRLSPLQFESLKAIGLWPVKHLADPIEDWHDLQRVRRRVRFLLQLFCPSLVIR